MNTLRNAIALSLKEVVSELDSQGRGDDADNLLEVYCDAIRLSQTSMQPQAPTNQIGPAPTPPQPPKTQESPDKAPQAITRNFLRGQELKAMEKSVRQMKSISGTLMADADAYYTATRGKVQKWRNFLKSEDFKMGLEAFRDAQGFPTMKAAYNAYMNSSQLKQDYSMAYGTQFGASK